MIKSKKGEVNIGILIMLFIGIIVAISLLAPIFDTQADLTTKRTITDESVSIATAKLAYHNINASKAFTVANPPSTDDWKVQNCPLGSIVVTNSTGTVLTLTTDYTLNSTSGVLNVVNNSDTVAAFTGTNVSLVDYTFCPDGYNPDGGSRSVAGLIGLFSVLALVAFTVAGIKNEWF